MRNEDKILRKEVEQVFWGGSTPLYQSQSYLDRLRTVVYGIEIPNTLTGRDPINFVWAKIKPINQQKTSIDEKLRVLTIWFFGEA